jgi:adenylate kinase
VIALLFGPPGSGKGTQSALVATRLGVPHVATGDMLRAEVARGSTLGREVQPLMESGALVPDELVVRVIESRLQEPDARGGAVLDGFPRTVAQAGALDAMLRRRGARVDTVVSLRVDDTELWERMQRRATLEGRADDNVDSFRTRLGVYRDQTLPVLEHYRQVGSRIEEIDGIGSIDQVTGRIAAVLQGPEQEARAS